MRSLRREHEQAYLDQARERLASDVAVSAALLDGPVAATVAVYAKANSATLIVMTTHGRGSVERVWLGSVADEVVRVSPVPLLLVRLEPGSVPNQSPPQCGYQTWPFAAPVAGGDVTRRHEERARE